MKRPLAVLSWLADRGPLVVAVAVVLVLGVGTTLAVRGGNRVKSLDEPSFYDVGKNLGLHLSFAHTTELGLGTIGPVLSSGEALTPTADRAPGYVLLIAPFIRLGADFVALRIVNVVLLAATMVLLWFHLSRSCSRLAGVLGVLFVLGYPVLLYLATTLYPQTLESILLLTTVLLMDRTRAEARPWAHALVGAALGVMILTAPIFLLLVPMMLLWLVLARRASLPRAALALGVAVLLVGLWTARNYWALGGFVPVATNGGYTLLAGNSPQTVYDQPSAIGATWSEEVARELQDKSEMEKDRIFKRVSLENMRNDPGRTFTLFCQKFAYWFAYSNQLTSDQVVPGGASGVPHGVRDLVMLLTYGPLLALLVLRLLMVRRDPPTALEVLIVALYLCAGLAYAIFFTRIRYRLPFDWLLIALDAAFLARLLERRGAGAAHDRPPTATRLEAASTEAP